AVRRRKETGVSSVRYGSASLVTRRTRLRADAMSSSPPSGRRDFSLALYTRGAQGRSLVRQLRRRSRRRCAMDSSAERNPGHEDIEQETGGKAPEPIPSPHNADEMDETQISLDDDDDDLDLDEDVTEEEVERADGA